MMTMVIAAVALSAVTILYKAAGPALLGNRTFPPRIQAVADALPAALLAAMLAVDLLGTRWRDFDPTVLPGLAVAIGLRALHRSHMTCIIAGVVATAALRQVYQ